MKSLIGRVKKNCSEECKGIEGVDLILMQFSSEDKELGVFGVLKLDDMERFYKDSYDKGLKDFISDDYNYCLYSVLEEESGLACSVKADDVDILREITKDDLKAFNRNYKKFMEIHDFAGIERKIKDEEKAENQANRRFEKMNKVKILAKTGEGYKRVNAVIYKGFAIHNLILYKCCSTSKSITALDGEFKGKSMGTYPAHKCKEIIDKVRSAIGDRPVNSNDGKKILEIVGKC